MSATDFIKLVNDLEYYLSVELQFRWAEEYPIGILDDIEIHFVHYDTCQQAKEVWDHRKKQVNLSRVLVLATDSCGFDFEVFEHWKKIRYPKLLFAAHGQYGSHPDVLYFPRYEAMGCVPDLTLKREFYEENILLQKVNRLEDEVTA